MATVFWVGNAPNISQVDTLTVSVAGVGGTITAIMGVAPYTVSVTYTVITGDTTSTAATALAALLSASTAPPQFSDATYSVTNNVITATAATPGTPFTLTASSGGGATMTRAAVTANSSQSDVNAAANWNRAGTAAIPQAADAVIVANSTVPLLWNLDQLAAVAFASFTRFQNFTGTIGLPENNPAGYPEYRPTYFQFIGNANPIKVVLGIGDGSGPTRERYNVLTQQVAVSILGSGSAEDAYAIRLLGTNASNTLAVSGTSVGVAMLPAEVSTMASATVDGGGSLDLGTGVTFSGALTFTNGSGSIFCNPGSLLLYSGSTVTVTLPATSATFTTVTVRDGSTLTWLAGGTISTLTMTNAGTFDKGSDLQAVTVTASTIDGGTCQILDPNNCLTYTAATAIVGQITAGPFVTGTGRTVKVA